MLNTLTLIALGLLLLSALILYLCRWRAFGSVVKLAKEQAHFTIAPDRISSQIHQNTDVSYDGTPQVSLILPSLNDGWWMERNLKYWLQQRSHNFEVIVADASDEAEDETENIVKRLQQEFKHLRYTRVPLTHRNIHSRKLAVTLGIRAARAPWVVILPPDGSPENKDWLARISKHFTKDVDVVMGYLNYDDSIGSPGRRAVYQTARRFAQQAEAAIKGTPIGCSEGNVALRREWFLELGGFIDSLEVPYGECALLVDARAEKGRVAVELHPEAAVRRHLPDEAILAEERRQQEHVYDRLISRHRWVFLRESIAQIFIYLAIFATLSYGFLRWVYFQGGQYPELRALGFTLPVELPRYEWSQLAYDIPTALLLILLLVAPIVAANRWCKALGERPFGTYTWTYELLQPWRKTK